MPSEISLERVSRPSPTAGDAMMDDVDIADHYALLSGTAPLPTGARAALTVHDLGVLRVGSGRLGACDPFMDLDRPAVVPIPAGDYAVAVTVADVSPQQDGSHRREAYLSIIISDGTPASVDGVSGSDGSPEAGQALGVGVDSGTVAFVDAESVARCMPQEANWYEEVFDTDEGNSWFAVMDGDTPHPPGLANVVLPLAESGENVVLAHSGWGDGFYPLLQTKDADGNLTAVHIDLLVVGKPGDAVAG